MKQKLDNILLSDNVYDEFYKNYNNQEFKQWILQILPEIENCKNLKQDNPWHIYNCLDHILHSVENINKQTKGLDEETRKMLAYVMFLHDIGKPKCKIRRFSKLYKREVDSFFNHNIASKEVANRVLPQFSFTKSQQDIMKLLIEEHDVFMFITLEDDGNKHHSVLSPELIDKMVEKFNKTGNGVELLNQLIMVGRSDNMAQNPKMTENSLLLLDKMSDMLNNKSQNLCQ